MRALSSTGSTRYVLARYDDNVYSSHVASIGENIVAARKAAGIKTQTALAKKMKIAQPQLSDWENDRYGNIEVKNLLRVAATIPCALDALVHGIDKEYDATRAVV